MRKGWKQYAWWVYPLNAVVTGLACLRELSRMGHGSLVELLLAKDVLIAGLALVLISLSWRRSASAVGDAVSVDGISDDGGLSLGGYVQLQSQYAEWTRRMGVLGYLPTSLIRMILLSPVLDLMVVMIVRRP